MRWVGWLLTLLVIVQSLLVLGASVLTEISAHDSGQQAQRLSQARWLDPDNPVVQEQQLLAAKEPEEKLHYLQALTRGEPARGIHWARLFSLQADLDLATSGTALRQAVRYAPYEPLAQYLLIESGMSHWADLSSDDRRILMGVGYRVLDSRAEFLSSELEGLIERSGLLLLLCLETPALPACESP